MVKVVDLQIQSNRVYYKLNGCSNDEFLQIIEYKSWLFKSWKYGTERKYFTFIYKNSPELKIVWSSVGFAPILIRHLQSLGWTVNGKENFRSKEINIGNILFQPYDFQKDAINSWLSCGCCGIIKSPTGSGKSFLACMIIQRMKVKTLITVHTNDLFSVWFDTLTHQFGDSIKSQIGVIGGKLSKNDRKKLSIVSDTGYESNIRQDIVIATSQSLLNKLDRLCNERFGLLVTDECHHYSSEQFSKVASNVRAPYRLGLSATLYRIDGTSPLFFGLLGDMCYKINIRELVDKKILVSPVFNTIVIHDRNIQSQISTCGLIKLDLSRYIKQMSASSIIKVNYILNLVTSLARNNKKFIVYTDFVNSKNSNVFTRDFYVEELNKKRIKVIGVSADMTGSERSKVFNMLEKGKLDGLIFGLLGSEGVNIPSIDSVVMCNATKSTIRYCQRIGRSMRTVKNDSSKKNAFVYEILLNTPMELKWSKENFYEYEVEGYTKERIYIK
ncbi:MAG: DEAD/DEAH box helicase [Candidatus Dojkabacteria bacterium]|nr:DEAD/DEAH box helicase [Candidatus Dojkabacteria bacterium]